MPPALVFFLSLVIEGALAGAIYALIALAFVLVYKSSRMINFAVGEWIMLGALLAGARHYAIGLGLFGAGLFAQSAPGPLCLCLKPGLRNPINGHPPTSP